MPQFNGDLIFIDTSGQVRVTNGSLTLRADDTGTKDIIVGSGKSFRPERNHFMTLGTRDGAWRESYVQNEYATSGFFGWREDTFLGDIATMTVGSGVIQIIFADEQVAGTTSTYTTNSNLRINSDSQFWSDGIATFSGQNIFITDASSYYDLVANLGTPLGNRWGAVYAASGVFNIVTPPTSGTFTLMHGGWHPNVNLTYDLGTSSLRWNTLFAGSGNFTQRPTVNNSGVLLQGEQTATVFSSSGNACITIPFTPANGTDFTLQHLLGTVDWAWSMWRTDTDPIRALVPFDITPSGINHVRIRLDSAISGKVVLVACGGSGTATYQSTIDFGSIPIEESGISVTNQFVTSRSIIFGQVAYVAPASKDLDEIEMDQIDLKFGSVANGSFTVYARGLEGPLHGEFVVVYSVANI